MDITDLKNTRRIAVMGGTFDPIHYGHLVTAEAVRYAFQPDRILFVPSGRPPHKDNATVTDSRRRYKMTALAVEGHPYFDVSRIEIDRPGPTYTIDTITALRAACRADAEIFFITGADAIEAIFTWKDAERLIQSCQFVAVTRPGYSQTDDFAALLKRHDARVHFLTVPALAISSTDIRQRVSEGRPIRYLLPPKVARYIARRGLYAGPFDQTRLERIRAQLAVRLSAERFRHSIAVAEESVRLAALHHADSQKAYLAGMLHDCAKECANKKALCRYYGITLDRVLKSQIDLTHSLLSAEAARDDFGVTDAEVLRAIRYHTTGHAPMGLLDKIVLLADYTEPGREAFPGLDEIRALAETNLDEAIITGLRYTLRHNEARGRLIHPWSRETIRSLQK